MSWRCFALHLYLVELLGTESDTSWRHRWRGCCPDLCGGGCCGRRSRRRRRIAAEGAEAEPLRVGGCPRRVGGERFRRAGFQWATAVLLGGFCSALKPQDFWVATVIIFIEAFR